MKKILFAVLLFSVSTIARSQSLHDKISSAVAALEKDSQLSHAILSFYVVETKTGKPVYEKNIQAGLAPASCQKIITSASAFELLGAAYRFPTIVYLDDNKNLSVEGFGDPTLGSWRYESTKNEAFFKTVSEELKKKGIKKINKTVTIVSNNFNQNHIPTGWIWEDIGNYYGAGAAAVNWRENQYDVILQAGNAIGMPVKIVSLAPANLPDFFTNRLTTGAKGSGDNAYIFPGLNGSPPLISGTIPLGENAFSISGAVTDPASFFMGEFQQYLQKNNLAEPISETATISVEIIGTSKTFYNYQSPLLDSINYWFLKKSVNLYGEAFIKAIAYEKLKTGSTEKGVELVKDFWKTKGIDPAALHILDGSGLSPANRITTHALVTVLQYARQQAWFNSFFTALPEMNGIKMKDGYISGVRSYAGYIKSKTGIEYTFSFIVNNFDGSAGTVREKIWKLLDLLK